MKRRSSSLLTLALLSAAALGCSDRPRALVLADSSGPAHSMAIVARAKTFEKRTGRSVKVMQVPPDQAVALASRGEVDVAVVPRDISLDMFIAAEHGRVAGLFNDDGEHLRILEVNAKQHPKVEAKGAKDLATALITPP